MAYACCAKKSRFYTCESDKPFVSTCYFQKLLKYKETRSQLYLPSAQSSKMHSPAGSKEEQLIVYDEDIFNDNIPIVDTSTETQSVLFESEEQDLEELAISFVDVPLESALYTSKIENGTSRQLRTSVFLKHTSEPYEMFQRLPYDEIKLEVPYKMPKNIDAVKNPVSKFNESFSQYTTVNDAIKPEISFVLRTPCIYHVDTETTSNDSSSSTKRPNSLKPVTQKYEKSVKIRTYRNPDGSVTEEKKITEHSSTLNNSNIGKSALYASDEDDTKFDDKYFNSLFKDVTNEFIEDNLNFLTNKEKQMNRASSSKKSKSEKIHTSEPMAELKLKTSISSKVVSSNAENASNEVSSSVSNVHPDIKRNRPVKGHFKESEKEVQSKISDEVSNKFSDMSLFSRIFKSKRTNATAPMVNPQLKTSISDKIVSVKAKNANYENVSNDINFNRTVKERPKEVQKETRIEIIDQVSKASSIVTIHSKNVDMKNNIVTESASINGITFKNKATNTDIKCGQLHMKEIAQNFELKIKIREEFDKVISNTGKKPSQKDFGKFCKKIYDKYGIYLKETQVDTHDSKNPLKLKVNNIEEIESNALKELEREGQILQEILNRIRSNTKVSVNQEKHSREDSITKIEHKSKDDNLSVKEYIEQCGTLCDATGIVGQQISTKIAPEPTSQKELRAFHPDKTSTDSDVTSKSERITKEHAVISGDSKVEMTLNDVFTADKEKLTEKRKAVQSEKDKNSVILPESEFSTQSHLKSKIKRIKEKGRPDKLELHSVYKEVSTTTQVSEISKLPSKERNSIQREDNVFVNKQEESEVDSTIDLKQIKAESEEFKRKIFICKKCLMALSGFIPSNIVEETEISADCQLCGRKEKQTGALILPNCNSSVTAEVSPSFTYSFDGKSQVNDTPGLSHNKCYDKKTWSEKYPCRRPHEDQKLIQTWSEKYPCRTPNEDQKLVSYNKVDESKVNDDVRKFVINDDDGKFVTTSNPCKSDKPAVSTVTTELDAKAELHNGTKEQIQIKVEGFNGTKEQIQTKPEGFNGTREQVQIKAEGFNGTKEQVQIKTEGFNGTKKQIQIKAETFNGKNGQKQTKAEGFNGTKEQIQIKAEGFTVTRS
ncbi:uncharacterized protein LOC113227530 [Hyposmocoma kahamanoa]|uniref:uncharacterized protein LOC113227530 n=1 Tax=Hyposmocoma kahamanoa TaxID=1477025 RepID=UPI000E6D806E|nr:uncharacterized protein LOC113227530 [Hyposmocoma kahamanoa]